MHDQYLLMTPLEAQKIRHHIQKHTVETDLLCRTVERLICDTSAYISQVGIEIPGHGEAGGYEHNRHKQNYIQLNNASQLWLITQEQVYLDFCASMLSQYADIYTNLTLNISKDTNPPGRLFHQTLNENMWLMYASLAYACIKADISQAQRQHIEVNLFGEMVTMFTETYAHDFDIIHNHGLWAVAGVGVCGLALNNADIANKAILGLKGDAESGGFLAQLKNLFSPDGYYMEGPYYHRFAIRPLLILAECIHRRMPELDIYHYEDAVIKRTTEALMSTAFPDGTFPALNDSSKTIGINDEGIIVAVSLYHQHYGCDNNIIAMAQIQNQVWLSASSIGLSQAAQGHKRPLNWGSLTINDGPLGDKGGLGILRDASQQDIHMATLWYGQHGSDHTLHSALDHGHFDGLHLSWFNQNQEVLNDYGFGRWVNVEPKFGGRYIPENKSYCKQTIAHNTVVVDENSQNQGDTATAEKRWGRLAYFSCNETFGQVMSAQMEDYYPGVKMQRTVVFLKRSQGSPLLLDLFEINSDSEHQYDLPIHYNGQITHTNFTYDSHEHLTPLGKSNGYQHLWHVASSHTPLPASSAMVSWLMGRSYYTMHTATNEHTQMHFVRTGANDPDFNLRSEPALVVRCSASNHLFATIYEQHGYFDESLELSEQARGTVEAVKVIHQCSQASVVEIIEPSLGHCLFCHWKQNKGSDRHQLTVNNQVIEWQGTYALIQATAT